MTRTQPTIMPDNPVSGHEIDIKVTRAHSWRRCDASGNRSLSSTTSSTPSHELHPTYAYWDDSQLDIDLADTSVGQDMTHGGGGGGHSHGRRQRFKEKFLHPIRHSVSAPSSTSAHSAAHRRSSWISASSTRSSLSSTHSLSYAATATSHSTRASNDTKLSHTFRQLKHLFIKKHV
ncbi:hypothetical protein BC940DRAFT_308230 [Gongronella butleri]|nr:hypothetical protein BC940DRAFT_308230 [Gongronella butleri]